MPNKNVFPFQVKKGSYDELRKILRFPEVTSPEIDEKTCRVTITDYNTDLTLKAEYREQYKKDNVFQIRLLDNQEREFIVMASMLERLNEPVIVDLAL